MLIASQCQSLTDAYPRDFHREVQGVEHKIMLSLTESKLVSVAEAVEFLMMKNAPGLGMVRLEKYHFPKIS